MPANPKYLTKNNWQKFAKLTAGLFGGYIISCLLHMALALVVPFHKEFLITSVITIYIVWVTLIITPYLFNNGWLAWATYAATIIILYGCYHLANNQNPFV